MAVGRIGLAVGAGLALAAVVTAGTWAAGGGTLPAGPNRDLVYGSCQTCHGLDALAESAGISRDQWDGVLASMVQYGLQVTPANRAKILDYLATYLGPHPPPAELAPASPVQPKAVNGATSYGTQCSSCHQSNGQGVAGYFPPLAGNHDLFLSRIYPVDVLLNGLTGKIEIVGQTFNGQMPSFSQLSDAEIAALVNYVRGAWGNTALRPPDMPPIDAETVTRARAKPMSSTAVHGYRAKRE